MSQSERCERHWEHRYYPPLEALELDCLLETRIMALLNHPDINKYCMVDAYYYDFSSIPDDIVETQRFVRDMYLIFGITKHGEMVTKWVERWDLDGDLPIVDGEVIHDQASAQSESPAKVPPEIAQLFDRMLMSTPSCDWVKYL